MLSRRQRAAVWMKKQGTYDYMQVRRPYAETFLAGNKKFEALVPKRPVGRPAKAVFVDTVETLKPYEVQFESGHTIMGFGGSKDPDLAMVEAQRVFGDDVVSLKRLKGKLSYGLDVEKIDREVKEKLARAKGKTYEQFVIGERGSPPVKLDAGRFERFDLINDLRFWKSANPTKHYTEGLTRDLVAVSMKRTGLYDYSFSKERIRSIRQEADAEAKGLCDYWAAKPKIGKGTPLRSTQKIRGLSVYDMVETKVRTVTDKGPKTVTLHSAMVRDMPDYPYHLATLIHKKDGEHIVLTNEVTDATAKKGPEFTAKRARAFFKKPSTHKLIAKDIAHELSHVHDFYNGDYHPRFYDVLPYALNPMERRAYKVARQKMPPLRYSLLYGNTPVPPKT